MHEPRGFRYDNPSAALSATVVGGRHADDCCHQAVTHGDRVDYVHDGHRHAVHGDHADEH